MSSSAASSSDSGQGEAPASVPAQGPGVKLLLPAVAIVVILAGITLLLTSGSSKPALPGNATAASSPVFAGSMLSPPVAAPPLDTLRNYDGSPFDLAAERGKVVFVTFLYTHCPDVCPIIASQLHDAYTRMTPAQRRHVEIVAVSVDPHGDTPAAVKSFIEQRALTGEARYLIGAAKPLARVWKAWNVGSEQDTSRPELVSHTALVYGVSASGRLYTIYTSNFAPEQLIHDIQPLLNR